MLFQRFKFFGQDLLSPSNRRIEGDRQRSRIVLGGATRHFVQGMCPDPSTTGIHWSSKTQICHCQPKTVACVGTPVSGLSTIHFLPVRRIVVFSQLYLAETDFLTKQEKLTAVKVKTSKMSSAIKTQRRGCASVSEDAEAVLPLAPRPRNQFLR